MEPVRVEFLMVDGMSARLTQAGAKVDTLKGKAKETAKEMDALAGASERVRRAVASVAGAFAARELVGKIANVRGEFQQLEVAFTTMLGSEEKANALMAQLVKTAATTPFDLQGVAQGAKQLLAYGEDVANVNDDLIRLGNIAAGLSQPLGDIVYLYGTTMTQGRLYTQDLNQFTGRGIPMIRELANVLGIAEDKVKAAVEAGKVGFPEVQKAIQNLTNEGGMFHNLMEAQSKTITGQIANIEDAISTMFNEIGERNEGVINTALNGVQTLVEHYEEVGKAVLAVATTYGTYRAALVVLAALERAHTVYMSAAAVAARASALGHTNLTTALVLARKAQAALNTTMLANPYALAAAAVVGLVVGVKSLCDKYGDARWRAKEYGEEMERLEKKYETERTKVKELLEVAQDEKKSKDERAQAIRELKVLNPDYFKDLDTERAKLYDVAEAQAEVTRRQKEAMRQKARATIADYNTEYNKYKSRYGVSHTQTVASVSRNTSVAGPDVAGMEQVRRKKELDEMRLAAQAAQKTLREMDKATEATDGSPKEKTTTTPTTPQRQQAKEEKAEERRLQARTELGEKERALELENQEEEIALMDEGREKKLLEIDKEYQQRAAEIEKKAHDLAEANKKAGETDVNGNGLTAAQQAEIDKANALNEKNKAKQVSDLAREDAEAMRAYLKDYGTYQERRLAIAEEYAEKIRKAESEGERQTLRQQQRDALRDFDNEQMRSGVDWERLFGDVAGMSAARLKSTKAELKGMLADGGLSVDDYQAIVEQIDKVNDALVDAETDQSLLGALIGERARERKKLEMEVAEAVEQQAQAMDAAAEAQSRLAQSRQDVNATLDSMGMGSYGGENLSVADSGTAMKAATARFGAESPEVKALQEAFDALADSTRDVTDSQEKLTKANENVEDKEDKKDNQKGKFSDKVAALKEDFDKVAQNFASLPALTGALGIDADSAVGRAAQGLADSASSASAAMGKFASGDYVGALADGINSIRSLGSAFGIGAGNAAEVARHIAELEQSNEDLQKAIEANTEALNESNGGMKSVEAAQKALEAQQETNENYLDIAKEQARYSHAHHSFNAYWKGLTEDQLAWARENLTAGSGFDGDIFSLSPEDMKTLLSNVEIRESIRDTGEGGYGGRVLEKLDDYAEQAGAVDDIVDTLNEKLTQTTFDDLRSNFLDTLMDMESDAEDFGEDMAKTLTQAMLNAWMSDNLDDRLQAFYDDYAAAAADGLTADEISSLQERYQALVDEAIAERDSIADITGYEGESGTSQTGKSGSFTTMTQDQGTKLEGMFTSGLQHWSSMDSRLEDVAARMDVAEGHLAAIAQNTGLGASHLDEIKEDLKKVIRDGLKVK